MARTECTEGAGLTIATTSEAVPWAYQDGAERYAEGLRRAGLPDDQLGSSVDGAFLARVFGVDAGLVGCGHLSGLI